MLEHVLLLTKTKEICVHMVLLTAMLVIIRIALHIAMHVFQVFNSVS